MPKATITLPSPAGGDRSPVEIALSRVTPDYADMVGMPVVRGRRLSETADAGNAEVLVNETFVARYFPDRDPLGTPIKFEGEPRRMTIVGITRDRHQHMSFSEIEPEVFFDFRSSFSSGNLLFVVQTRGKENAMAAPVRARSHLPHRRQPTGPATRDHLGGAAPPTG